MQKRNLLYYLLSQGINRSTWYLYLQTWSLKKDGIELWQKNQLLRRQGLHLRNP